jgi:HAE1 family hydrophobic/amphiphilic exporter-1
MTALATIFALAPMAFGLTGGGVFISRPLAIVVIGGLLSSTLLTLVLVPVLYTLTERRGERKRLARADADGADGTPGASRGAHAADAPLDAPAAPGVDGEPRRHAAPAGDPA